MVKSIFFYWDGNISDSRKRILDDCLYSTRMFNPEHTIILISNSLKEEDFNPRFNIIVQTWDYSIFDDLPISRQYVEEHYTHCNPRERSDLMRIVYLYKFGGSYVDTDDLAIKSLPTTKNLVCRSYDPHTCHYNNLSPEDCLPGSYRDVPGYNEIPIFPRNDCWLNFEPRSKFIHTLLSNKKITTSNKAIYIGDDFSWQSLTLETCKELVIGEHYNLGLTLLYLYEDFVAASSYWDRCLKGGEMCDVYSTLPEIKDFEWGFYKCTEEVAINFYRTVCEKYPNLSHMWLHSKDMKDEWMLDELDPSAKYSVSTWIYNHIKKQYT